MKRTLNSPVFAGVASLMVICTLQTNGVPVASEAFDYSTSTAISGQTGGTGWAGAWTTGGTSLATASADESLWFGQDPTRIIDDTAHVGLNSANGYSNSRDLGTTIPLSSETLYFAMLFRVDASTQAAITVSFGRSSDDLTRGTVQVDDGNLLVDASTGGFVAGAGGLYTTSQNYLLAMKRVGGNVAGVSGIYASVIAGDENPATLVAEPVSWQMHEFGASGIDVDRMFIDIDGGGSVTRIDDIRVATDWASAVDGLVSGMTFAQWIADEQWGLAEADRDFNDDPDGDDLDNGVEAFFGTDPSAFSEGLTQVSKSGSLFAFQHLEANPALTDVTGSYDWSTDLQAWHPPGTVGNTTVTITPSKDDPVNGTTTVTADTTGSTTPPGRIFVRVSATQGG